MVEPGRLPNWLSELLTGRAGRGYLLRSGAETSAGRSADPLFKFLHCTGGVHPAYAWPNSVLGLQALLGLLTLVGGFTVLHWLGLSLIVKVR